MSRNYLGRLPFQPATPSPLGDRRPGQRDVSIAMRLDVTRHCDVLSAPHGGREWVAECPPNGRPPKEHLKLARHRTTIKLTWVLNPFCSVHVSVSRCCRSSEKVVKSSRGASTFTKCNSHP